MQTPFVEPGDCNDMQLLFLTVIYAVILYQSSNLISGGSELLLFFPSVAGLVGSIVLPILGAVPDGVMVLFSGLGPDAQNQVSVGVGALAGSTVMLLTAPWFLAVMSGSVPLENGTAKYGAPAAGAEKVKGCAGMGVTFQPSLQKAVKIMFATTALFFVIQLPSTAEEIETSSVTKQASAEGSWAGVGVILCILAFCAYLWYCFKDANEDKQLAQVIEGIKKKKISIGAALRFVKSTGTGSSEELLPADEERLKKIVRPFFAILDTNRNGSLDLSEFKTLLHLLGEKPTPKASEMFNEKDRNRDGQLGFEELMHFLGSYLMQENMQKFEYGPYVPKYLPAYEEDEEEEEVPEDLADMSPDQQLKRILFRAIWMMGVGTVLVLIFSDPMVDILSEWGNRLGVSPFYISFVVAPFASNASELLAAYNYAAKKSSKSITTALSTLVGAAIMNNTFCLAIFLALVYCKDLAWRFTAETVAIVVIQWAIGAMVLLKTTQSKLNAVLILMCYPGCLFLVWFFENIFGMD